MAPSFGRHNLKNYLTQWYKKKTKEKKKKKKTREENFKKSKKKIRKLHIINIYIPGIYISIYKYKYKYKFISVVYANHFSDIIYYMFSTNTNINN